MRVNAMTNSSNLASVALRKTDRRGVLGALAGALGLASGAVAAVASSAVDAEAEPNTLDDAQSQLLELLTMLGQMEADGRIGWATMKDGRHSLNLRMTDAEHLKMLSIVAAGMVLGGHRDIEHFEAILMNREVL